MRSVVLSWPANANAAETTSSNKAVTSTASRDLSVALLSTLSTTILATTSLDRWFPSRWVVGIQLTLNAVELLFRRGSIHVYRMAAKYPAERLRARARSLSKMLTRVIADASAKPNRSVSNNTTTPSILASAGRHSMCRSDQGTRGACRDQLFGFASQSLVGFVID